jgi:cupin superfamily acireductone dioxygenase involved in methionine salvage
MKDDQVILHGEAMIFPVNEIPTGAVQIVPSRLEYHIIADSETTGNHHVVSTLHHENKSDKVRFFKKNNTVYMQNDEPTEVSCVHTDRHSPITIPPGVYEFGTQQEYDHFEQNLRNVRD